MAAESGRLTKELVEARSAKADSEHKIVELLDKLRDKTNDFQKVNFAYDAEHLRNLDLLKQVQALGTELDHLKLGGSSATLTAVRPPPQDLEGLVVDTDVNAGLMTLSIGSDSGLNKDNTLQIYRLGPKPTYLGTVRIVAVKPHEAVARPLSGAKITGIQKGDKVATNIMGH